MVSLTDHQRRVLDQLLHGATGRSRSRHLPALKAMGYLDRNSHPTARAWNEFGEWRYMPRLRIPQDWEIDTWRDELLWANESQDDTDPDIHGPNNWNWRRVKDVSFVFSIYEIMRFYRDAVTLNQAYLQRDWTASLDDSLEIDRLTARNRGNDIKVKSQCLRSAIQDTARVYSCPNTGSLVYAWGEQLYQTLELNDNRIYTTVSYRYSLQHNVDEIQRFLARPGYNSQQRMRFTRIAVD